VNSIKGYKMMDRAKAFCFIISMVMTYMFSEMAGSCSADPVSGLFRVFL